MCKLEFYQKAVGNIKYKIENAIRIEGKSGYDSVIRGSEHIQLVHDAIKLDLIENGIDNTLVYPPLFANSPEIKLTGKVISKRQDICVIPKGIEKKPTYSDVYTNDIIENDVYGVNFTEHCLVINVKSQMSSLQNNFHTLYTGFIGENTDLKARCPNIVTANLLMIPTNEYDPKAIKNNKVVFKQKHTDIEKYIRASHAMLSSNIIGRSENSSDNERFCLLVVDFSKETPYVYTTSDELIRDGLISKEFASLYSYEKVSVTNLVRDLIRIYNVRFDLKYILKCDKKINK